MCIFSLSLLEVWWREKKKSTRHPKHAACERKTIYRLTPPRETALPSCLGSALHKGERREEEGDSLLTQHRKWHKVFWAWAVWSRQLHFSITISCHCVTNGSLGQTAETEYRSVTCRHSLRGQTHLYFLTEHAFAFFSGLILGEDMKATPSHNHVNRMSASTELFIRMLTLGNTLLRQRDTAGQPWHEWTVWKVWNISYSTECCRETKKIGHEQGEFPVMQLSDDAPLYIRKSSFTLSLFTE